MNAYSWRTRFVITVVILAGLLWINPSVKAAEKKIDEVNNLSPDPAPPLTNPISGAPQIDNPAAFMPLVNKTNQVYPTSPLGGVIVKNGPYLCDPVTNQSCYDLTVTCSQLTQPRDVTLKVGEPTQGATLKGTIMFFSGYTGTYFWETIARNGDENLDASLFERQPVSEGIQVPEAVNYPQMIVNLRDDGFRTVQVDWASNWYLAESGIREGMGDLSCRPASVMRWVYDQLHGGRPDQPFCADGHSNGASQLGYSLVRYGMGKYLDLAVFESGPNWTYLDHSCIQDDPNYQDIWTPDDGRKNFDLSYGYPDNGAGPCGQKLNKWRTTFQTDSLGYGNWQFIFPRTMLAFLFGDLDTLPATRNSGKRFSDLLVSNANPLLSRVDLPNTGHNIGATLEGMAALESTLSTECKLR